MIRKVCFVLFFLPVLAGCSTTTRTETLKTPSGVTEVKESEGPYSHDTSVVVKTDQAYRDCLRRMGASLPPMQADAYCRGQTSGGGVSVGYGSGAVMAMPVVGPGMMAPMSPGYYSGLPGARLPFLMRSSAQSAMDRMPGMAVPVSVAGPSQNDGELIAKELANQHQRICKLEGKDGKPCK